MKTINLILLLSFSLSTFSQKDQSSDGDLSYDEKTQSIIPNYLGKVALIRGNVEAIKDNKKRSPKKSDKIYPGEAIKTQQKSFVKIEMVDTTILAIGPNSTLSFDEWQYKTKEDRNLLLNLRKGKIRSHFKVKAIGNEALKIKVGHVTMGVRGTEILANYYQREDSSIVSHVATLSGSTTVYDSVKDETHVLNEGDQYISFLSPDGKVLKVKKSSLEDKDLEFLKSKEQNGLKYFRPFLEKVGVQSSNKKEQESSQKDFIDRESNNLRKRSRKKKSWKNTLRNLNEALQEKE